MFAFEKRFFSKQLTIFIQGAFIGNVWWIFLLATSSQHIFSQNEEIDHVINYISSLITNVNIHLSCPTLLTKVSMSIFLRNALIL